MDLSKYFQESKIIAAVKDDAAFERALASRCPVIFLLYGDILNVKRLVDKAHARGKVIFLHFDMIEGFGKDETADHGTSRNSSTRTVSFPSRAA